MTLTNNEILISSSVERVWNILIDLELLEKYDPTVKNQLLSQQTKQVLGQKEK